MILTRQVRRPSRAQKAFSPSLLEGGKSDRLEGRFLTAPAIYRATNYGGDIYSQIEWTYDHNSKPMGAANNFAVYGPDNVNAQINSTYTKPWWNGWTNTAQVILDTQISGPTSSPSSNTASVLTTVQHDHLQTVIAGIGTIPTGFGPTLISTTGASKNWVVKDPGGGNLSGTIHISFTADYSISSNGIGCSPVVSLQSTYLNVLIQAGTTTITPQSGAISSTISAAATWTNSFHVSVELEYALPSVTQLGLFETFASQQNSDVTGSLVNGSGEVSGFGWSFQMTVSP